MSRSAKYRRKMSHLLGGAAKRRPEPVPEHLESMLFSLKFNIFPQEHMPGSYKILRDHGTWERKESQPEAGIGVAKGCFHNAHTQAKTGLELCVGFAFKDSMPFPIAHAWNLDAEGSVMDTTPNWTQGAWYFGVPVPLALWEKVTQGAGFADILDNWSNNHDDEEHWVAYIHSKSGASSSKRRKAPSDATSPQVQEEDAAAGGN